MGTNTDGDRRPARHDRSQWILRRHLLLEHPREALSADVTSSIPRPGHVIAAIRTR